MAEIAFSGTFYNRGLIQKKTKIKIYQKSKEKSRPPTHWSVEQEFPHPLQLEPPPPCPGFPCQKAPTVSKENQIDIYTDDTAIMIYVETSR